jgi:hypothetical protein
MSIASTFLRGGAMQTRAGLLALIQELEGDIRELERACSLNERAWERIQNGAVDALDWGALGYTIHSAYGIIENYFLRVSKHFENSLPTDQWHKALIERMALEIPDIRPAMIRDEKLKKNLMELLKFRHRFRNLYGEELDAKKTAAIQGIFEEVLPELKVSHRRFVESMLAISGAL